jgi:lysophospholipid acyltransferase (LPLAT)-like uncharacterized protein
VKVTKTRARWLGRIGAAFIRVLGRTWRPRRIGATLPLPHDPRFVFAFLHGDMLLPAFVYRRVAAAIVISQHGDGEIIAQVIARLNKRPVRGSSSRGGARAVLELMKRHDDVPWAITPDGPRGPRGVVHEGAIALAAQAGRPIYPIGFAVSRGKRLRSWDAFVVPAPFCRVVECIGEPLVVPADADGATRAALALELGRRLAEAGSRAAEALASG